MAPECIQMAAAVIRQATQSRPADAVLRDALKSAPALPAADRRAVAQAVFAYYRWRGWHDRKREVEARIAWSLELAERFRKNPFTLTGEALRHKAVPAWLLEEMDCPEPWLRSLQWEPRLWLRARPGRARPLANQLGQCKVPKGWLMRDAVEFLGTRDLFATEAFQGGAFELQDIGSQAVGVLCAPQPGEVWWDTCAGEGGKTLHLADQMQGRGQVFASDKAEWRLAKLRQRAARAGVQNYQTAVWAGTTPLPFHVKFDGILVDAPCSGVGTWQRNPHARWTCRPQDVHELAQLQLQLLTHAAAALKPGGRLLYAVCTLTRAETSGVASAFTTACPDFLPLPLPPLRTDAAKLGIQGQPSQTLWPQELGGNGMFVAAWQRRV
ncbi:MAG TPA: RsmB/NOP family class I SAM-dependent RNA methyltransferase [Verrucomicrobiae bacterium]|nr:RsmB/NOP family class I SAM-dependent RNA methyltransferase [Verrucomicrobiae bacterium]